MHSNTAAHMEITRIFQSSLMIELDAALNKLFQSADSAVLKLACEASENKEQNRYFEAVQALRIVRSELTQTFFSLLLSGQAYNEQDVDIQHMQSLRRLVSIDVNLAANTQLRSNEEVLQKRLTHLSPGFKNLLVPEQFVDSFLFSLAKSEFDMQTKMLVLRLFEDKTYSQISHFVVVANRALSAANILPELNEGLDKDDSVDAIVSAALGGDRNQVVAASTLELALADLQADSFDELDKNLLPASVLACEQVAVKDFMPFFSANTCVFESQDIEKMQLVQQLFTLLLADEAMPLPARFMLSLLQLPFARIALVEKDFLQSQSHPARMLLAQIAELATIWERPSGIDALEKDVFFSQLQDIVKVFYEAERVHQIPFADLLFSLVVYAEERRQKSARFSEQLIESENSGSSSDRIREEITSVLDKKTAGLDIPIAIERVLNDGWAHVLYMQAMEFGLQSDAWKAALVVVDDLLWTAQPSENYENREVFLKQLPRLLHALRMGMYAIELSSALIHQLLVDLETLHKTCIVQISDSGLMADFSDSALLNSECESAIPLIDARNNRLALKLKQQAEILEPAPEKVPEPAIKVEVEIAAEKEDVVDNTHLLEGLGQGVWLIWNKPERKERCQIAAHIKHAKKYILTNSGGKKIADFTETGLSDLLASGEMELAEAGHVFEKALESVIGGIRDKR